MNYREYEEKANQTPIYDKEVAIPYVVIGLAGELGEMFEKIENEASVEDIVLEVGDALWYLAMIRVELNLPLEEDWDWKKNIQKSSPFIISELGKISEQVKKYLRDDWKKGEENIFPEKRKEAILKSWKNVWAGLNGLAMSLGTSIDEVAIKNNEKLASRAKRNVIHGAGDYR